MFKCEPLVCSDACERDIEIRTTRSIAAINCHTFCAQINWVDRKLIFNCGKNCSGVYKRNRLQDWNRRVKLWSNLNGWINGGHSIVQCRIASESEQKIKEKKLTAVRKCECEMWASCANRADMIRPHRKAITDLYYSSDGLLKRRNDSRSGDTQSCHIQSMTDENIFERGRRCINAQRKRFSLIKRINIYIHFTFTSGSNEFLAEAAIK